MHVVSVGAARHDQQELEAAVFARADVLVCDSVRQVMKEAGDAYRAVESGAITADSAIGLAQLFPPVAAPGRTSPEQITVFKSVGTALQDLALASIIYRAARERGLGSDIGLFPAIKAF
jgi:ornithine cyclodeaminase/alanine dehydrogenase-like protein (mu-crystallin family)